MEKFLREIEGLKITPRRKILQGSKGNTASYGLGTSTDFFEHRSYVPQDDLRKLDWKIYCRTKELYVRQFTEESQIHIKIILDASLSMDYGTYSKFQLAKQLAIGIGYLALKGLNLLTVVKLTHQSEVLAYKLNGLGNFYGFKKRMEGLACEGKTNYEGLLQTDVFYSGITFFLTDFLSEGYEKALDFLNVRGEETIGIHILAEEEKRPKLRENLRLVDIETGEKERIAVTKELYSIYQRKINSFLEDTKVNCSKRGIKYVFSETTKSPAKILFEAIGGI
ncbi:DUF58 domain-containing protein [Clostridium formicaceticum]|uniref:DUF58 domain-containing protein n=1 Tax=Clostridium formicaceticum TaxID=1497 RepID=A0AAC9WF18_9CLOT|nr:DUF58 domain-containing protein [Clostridium formicaceticum]AOY75878.1 hypothetical protein BJL90_08215 [Clostridium formicaceticum]ARE86219.1 hypothetical protein CLFO_05410 [Clostridium formicaceticum]